MRKFLFNISDLNYNSLKKISDRTNKPISSILNKIISDSLENQPDIEKLKFNPNENKKFKEVKVNLTDDECLLIKKFSEKNMHNSVKKELRFMIVNNIYNYRFNSEIELKTFILAKNALNAIGRNLNQFIRELKKKNLISINHKEMEKTISNISSKIDFLMQKLDKLVDNTERIFK